jgi:chromosome segregation ATPase
MNGAEKNPQDEKEINNSSYTVAAIERRTRIKHGITTGRKPAHPDDESSNATSMKRKSDLEEKAKSAEQETAALSEQTKKIEQEIQKLRNELKRKENRLRKTQKAAAEAELKADRKLSEKSEMIEDLKMELREKDALLAKSKQVEDEFRSQIENEISEKTALKTETAAVLKDQQAKHEKECLQYENQVRELQHKLDFCNEATAAA